VTLLGTGDQYRARIRSEPPSRAWMIRWDQHRSACVPDKPLTLRYPTIRQALVLPLDRTHRGFQMDPVFTRTSLSTSPTSPVVEGTRVTLTATVTPPLATDTVQFKDGTRPLGPPVTVVNGTAGRDHVTVVVRRVASVTRRLYAARPGGLPAVNIGSGALRRSCACRAMSVWPCPVATSGSSTAAETRDQD
jgi:hypothetical protein